MVHTPPGNFDRIQIQNSMINILHNDGKSIDDIEKQKKQKYKGESLQIKHRNESVWHITRELADHVASDLRINSTFWGSTRSSDEFYSIINQEIYKLGRKKQIIYWNSSKQFGVFRLETRVHIPKRTEVSFDQRPESQDLTIDEYSLKQAFVSILTKGKKDNTYKFALARALLDYCSENENHSQTHEIPYRYLSEKFLKYYWHQECKFRIKQDFHSKKSPKIIQAIREVFDVDKPGNNDPGNFDLIDDTKKHQAEEKILKTVFGHARSKTSMVVPKFQNISKGNSVDKRRFFYDFSDDEQKIYLKPEAFGFFRNNYAILSGLVFVEWAKYLEKINDSLPRLVAKIYHDEVNRGPLTEYQKIYWEHTCDCFYCNDKLERGYIHVDHFIPWSYIFEDSAWNLVLACPKCNLKKSNSLAQEEFCDDLVQRNSKYQDKLKKLKQSLMILDAGRGWKIEIKNHYTRCKDYGFSDIQMP